MHTTHTIESDIRQFVVENFLFGEADGLEDAESFLERGIIDSTGVLELVSFIEGRYAISVEDNELVPANLDSVSAVGRFVREKLERQGPSRAD